MSSDGGLGGGAPAHGYGRVSDAEQYRQLHEVVDSLVAALMTQYEVDCSDDAARAGECAFPQSSPERVVRLIPRSPDAAPITVVWTSFPGLQVRFGRWHVDAYPRCGCDACGERCSDLIEDLRQAVDAVVGGRFVESFDGRCVTAEMTFAVGGRGGGSRLVTDDQILSVVEATEHRWRPWPARGR